MANTYTLISSNTLSSTTSSVTFSAIDNSYSDLIFKVSARTNTGSTQSNLAIEFNGDSSSLYSSVILFDTGNTAYSQVWNNLSYTYTYGNAVGSTATSNTFSNFELYLPNYNNNAKTYSTFGVTENNSSTDASICINAGYYNSANAITSVRFFANDSSSFVANSSFWLYGIKNS